MRAIATVTTSTSPFFYCQSRESQGHGLCFCFDRFDLRFEQLIVESFWACLYEAVSVRLR